MEDTKRSDLFTRRKVLAAGATIAGANLAVRRARAQGKSLQTINIVNAAGNLTAVLEEMMLQQGFLEKFGLTTKPVYVADGTKIMGSLIAGEMDLCPLAGFSQVFPAVEKGAKLKMVNGSVVLGQQTVFSARPDIKTIKDLKGKTIGVGSLGAQLHQVMVALLLKNGVDPADVTFANIGSSADVFKAISVKVVDAGPGQIDFIPQIDKFGVHIVEGGDMWTNLSEYPFQGGFTTDRVIGEKRDMLVRALAAYASLFRFLCGPSSKDAWFAARRKALNGKDAEFDAGSQFQWDFIQKAQPFALDLILSEARLDYVQDLNVRLGIQKVKVPYGQVADMSIARDALKLI